MLDSRLSCEVLCLFNFLPLIGHSNRLQFKCVFLADGVVKENILFFCGLIDEHYRN